MNTRVCMCLLTLLLSIQLYAAKKQEVQSKQWVAQYKGSGTLKVMEGFVVKPKPYYDSGGLFTGFDYLFESNASDMFGVSNATAVFLVENGDEKGVLKVKPRKDIASYTQFFQVVGSNSHFKLIKLSIAKDNTHLSLNPSQAVFIDGSVRTFISTIPLMATQMYFQNVERFTVPDIFVSQIRVGRPAQRIPDGYVDWGGSSNAVYVYTDGNIGKITVKNAVFDSDIYAGTDRYRVYTKDLAAVYSAYPPSGTIGSLKARLIAGSGDLSAFWVPTTIIAASSRPKLKVPSDQIVTENTSVFITP